MNNIRLSVIMTNYNHGHFLEERLCSILAQLIESDEVVIVDDGSTDRSVEIIEKIKSKDPRVHLWQNKKNEGVIYSVNLALDKAQGIYIASLAADDKILPGFISKTMSVLERNPELSMCCSDCGLSYDGFPNRDPEKIETTKLIPFSKSVTIFSAKDVICQTYKHDFWVPGHSVIIKRQKMLEYGGFKKNLEYMCDWFLIHSIALTEGVGYIPETLSVWRQHPKTYSSTCIQDEARKKKIFFELFTELSKNENCDLRKRFAQSTRLYYQVKPYFKELVRMPRMYDIVLPITWKAILKKIQALFR